MACASCLAVVEILTVSPDGGGTADLATVSARNVACNRMSAGLSCAAVEIFMIGPFLPNISEFFPLG